MTAHPKHVGSFRNGRGYYRAISIAVIRSSVAAERLQIMVRPLLLLFLTFAFFTLFALLTFATTTTTGTV